MNHASQTENTEQKIWNQSFDKDFSQATVEMLGYDGQNLQRQNADNLKVVHTNDGTYDYYAFASPGTATSAPTISTNLTGTTSTVSNSITPTVTGSQIIDCLSSESSPTIVNTGSPSTVSEAALENQSYQWGTTSDKGNISGTSAVTMGYSNASGNTWSYVQMVLAPGVSVTAQCYSPLPTLGVG